MKALILQSELLAAFKGRAQMIFDRFHRSGLWHPQRACPGAEMMVSCLVRRFGCLAYKNRLDLKTDWKVVFQQVGGNGFFHPGSLDLMC